MKKLSQFFLFIFTLQYSSHSLAWGLKELGEEAASPVTTTADRILLYGGIATLTAIVFEDNIDVAHDKVVNDKPLGDFSRYGDWAGQMVPNALYVLGQTMYGAAGNRIGFHRALGMFKATAYAASITTVLKYTIREPRPDIHNERNSFPSGHTTTAFAFGGYILEEHGWQWGVPALLISSFSGLSRVNDNRHRIHDVLAGATIGLAYGVAIAKIDRERKEKSEHHFTVVPIFDQQTKGLALIGSF